MLTLTKKQLRLKTTLIRITGKYFLRTHEILITSSTKKLVMICKVLTLKIDRFRLLETSEDFKMFYLVNLTQTLLAD
jgi:hypothetical protein